MTMVSWVALGKALPEGEGRWSCPVLSPDETSPGVLCSILGSSGQDKHGAPGAMLGSNFQDTSAQIEVQMRGTNTIDFGTRAKVNSMDFV